MTHPLALSAEYRDRLISNCLLTIAPKEFIPRRPVKEGGVRHRKKPQGHMTQAQKEEHVPPLCRRAGCFEPAKYYDVSASHPHGGYGKMCVKHAHEAAVNQSAANQRAKAREGLRTKTIESQP